MKIVVTGASGLLGGNLTIELLSRGHHVRATRRTTSKVAHLADKPVEWVTAELSDRKALTTAFQGADAVFHCAALVSIRRKTTPEIFETNVTGTRNVVRAASEAGVRKLVHCSSANAIGLSENGKPSTEQARWNFAEHGMADGYTVTKHRAETVVAEEGAALDWVIVNPCFLIGPNDSKPSTGRLIVDVARRKIPGWFPGINNFVDVRDVARGMILALEKGKRGERYILGGQNLAYRDIIERIARAANVKPPARQLPRPAARLFGIYGDLQERFLDKEPLLNSMTVEYGFSSAFQLSSEKAERELGYEHGPIEPAIADAIAYFRRNGML